MRRAVAVASISTAIFALLALSFPSGAAAAYWTWTCQAESNGASSAGDGDTKKEAQDRALGNCASRSARFAECRILKCSRGHRAY